MEKDIVVAGVISSARRKQQRSYGQRGSKRRGGAWG